MITGCYDLVLYCDADGCHGGRARGPSTFEATDEFGSACRTQVRQAGWILRRDGTCVCPACAKRSKP